MTTTVPRPRRVVVLRADVPVGRAAAERLRASGDRVLEVAGDPADGAVRRAGLEEAVRTAGRLDAVVLAPAAAPGPPYREAGGVDLELRTAFFGVQDAARNMTGGRIVLAAPLRATATAMCDAATMLEGAFVALVRLLAVELAPRRFVLNALCPIAAGAEVDAIAAGLAFLASDEASYMSGACLPVAAPPSPGGEGVVER